MASKISFSLFTVVLLSTPKGSRAQSAIDYTLDKALESALKTHTDVLQRRERLNEADAAWGKTTAVFFPQLEGQVSALEKKDAVTSPSARFNGEVYNSYSVDLVLTQPLLQGGALWGERNRLKIDLESKKVDVEMAERDVSAQVIRAFYAILLADAQYTTYLKQEKINEEMLRTAQARAAVGNERDLVVLQFQTELALLRKQIIDAKNQLTVAAVNFTYLVGEAREAAVKVKGSLEAPEWKSLRQRMASQMGFSNLEIQSQTLAIDALEQQKLVVMSPHWPSLVLTGDVGRDGTAKSSLTETNATRWYFGLKMNVPLFSGLTSFQDRKILAAQAARLRAADKGLRDRIATQLATAEKNIEDGLADIDAARVALDLAQKTAPLAKRRYNLGVATYVQYSDAQKNLLTAQLSLDQARASYIQRMLDYFVAAGWPLKDFVAALPSPPAAR